MTTECSQPQSPAEANRLLNSIVLVKVLGASRQLHVLGECLTSLARAHADDLSHLRADVTALETHVRRTRGASSQAVTNGLALMAKPVLTSEKTAADRALGMRLITSVDTFRTQLSGWQESIRGHATALLSGYRDILVYDYSSTVSQAIVELSRSGKQLHVIVPEARSLDGGRKYLADWQDLDITLNLVPDSAVGWGVAGCDVVLVGAETLSLNGGCYNTIGTSIAAKEAGLHQVPFYVLSILLKTDLATVGAERPSPSLNFLTLTPPTAKPKPPQRAVVQDSFPDLDYTEPGAITGIVTEEGCLIPANLAAAARAVLADSQTRP